MKEITIKIIATQDEDQIREDIIIITEQWKRFCSGIQSILITMEDMEN
jgi:hypothetical protein